jgi:hypothetical protein
MLVFCSYGVRGLKLFDKLMKYAIQILVDSRSFFGENRSHGIHK